MRMKAGPLFHMERERDTGVLDLSISLPFLLPQPRAHRSSLSRDFESSSLYSNQKGWFVPEQGPLVISLT